MEVQFDSLLAAVEVLRNAEININIVIGGNPIITENCIYQIARLQLSRAIEILEKCMNEDGGE